MNLLWIAAYIGLRKNRMRASLCLQVLCVCVTHRSGSLGSRLGFRVQVAECLFRRSLGVKKGRKQGRAEGEVTADPVALSPSHENLCSWNSPWEFPHTGSEYFYTTTWISHWILATPDGLSCREQIHWSWGNLRRCRQLKIQLTALPPGGGSINSLKEVEAQLNQIKRQMSNKTENKYLPRIWLT